MPEILWFRVNCYESQTLVNTGRFQLWSSDMQSTRPHGWVTNTQVRASQFIFSSGHPSSWKIGEIAKINRTLWIWDSLNDMLRNRIVCGINYELAPVPYSKPCQISKIKIFAKIVKLVNYFLENLYLRGLTGFFIPFWTQTPLLIEGSSSTIEKVLDITASRIIYNEHYVIKLLGFVITRSNHQRSSIKKLFLKISQDLLQNTCAGVSF